MHRRNLNYWDSVSTLAGEVSHPRKTFPRALFIAVGLVVLMYLGPLMVGLGVTVQTDQWELGYFTKVATMVRCASPCGCLVVTLVLAPYVHSSVSHALRAALQVGGGWLSWWMISAAAVSQIGQFEVLSCAAPSN